MKVINAIKKLERQGWTVEKAGYRYLAQKNGGKHVIEFLPNGPDHPEAHIASIRVMGRGDADDSQSDYHAGVYVNSISRALQLAT